MLSDEEDKRALGAELLAALRRSQSEQRQQVADAIAAALSAGIAAKYGKDEEE